MRLPFGDFIIGIVSPIPAWRKRMAGSGNGPDRGKETPLPAEEDPRRGTLAQVAYRIILTGVVVNEQWLQIGIS